VLSEFKKYLTSQNIAWTEADLNGAMDWLKINIKEKIITIQFGQLQGLRARADSTVVRRAGGNGRSRSRRHVERRSTPRPRAAAA